MAKPKVQSVDQILKTLEPGFAPQKQLINKQIASAPGRFAAQQQGLEAQQRNQFGKITEGANQRGLLFSGVPLKEQAEFTSDVFLPAVAGLKTQENDFTFGLQSALNELGTRQREQALSERTRQQTRLDDFLARQEVLREQRRAAAAQQAAMFNSQQSTGNTSGANSEADPERLQAIADRAILAAKARKANELSKKTTVRKRGNYDNNKTTSKAFGQYLADQLGFRGVTPFSGISSLFRR